MITVTYKSTRTDTSTPFFVDAPENADLVARWVELSEALDITHTKEISDDQLELTTKFVFESQELASMYQFVIDENLPEWISERNLYYVTHRHTLVGVRMNGAGEENTFVTI